MKQIKNSKSQVNYDRIDQSRSYNFTNNKSKSSNDYPKKHHNLHQRNTKSPHSYNYPYYHTDYRPRPLYSHQYPYPQYYQYYQYYPKESSPNIGYLLAGLVIIPSFIFLGFIFIMNLFTLLIGVNIVLPNLGGNSAFIALILPWPGFIYIVKLSGTLLIFWYFFIVTTIIVSIVLLIMTEGRDFFKILVKSAKKMYPPPLRSNNSFIIIAELFFILWFFNIVVILFILAFGLSFDTPISTNDPKTWELLFALANASVWEEIFTRILYIGIPLFIIDFYFRKQPEKVYKYFIGGGFKIEKVTISLIIFSSLLFGLAHYPSWGLWKVVPTFVAGLAFGYLFVRKGIHTAIILHFLIDYMGVVLILFNDNLTVLIFLTIFFGIMMLAWMGSGLIYFGLYIYRFLNTLAQKFFKPLFTGSPVLDNTNQQINPNFKYYSNEFNRHYRYSSRDLPEYYKMQNPIQKKQFHHTLQSQYYCPYCGYRLKYIKSIGHRFCQRCFEYIY